MSLPAIAIAMIWHCMTVYMLASPATIHWHLARALASASAEVPLAQPLQLAGTPGRHWHAPHTVTAAQYDSHGTTALSAQSLAS